MNFIELAYKRFSCRSYKQTPVEKDDIMKCVEAARLAPSACNSQPWKFVIVDLPELKAKLADVVCDKALGMNSFAHHAPVIVAIVSQRQKLSARLGGIIKRKSFSQMDIGITSEHFCLQAAELGLGTCMIGWFNEKQAKKLLNVPAGQRIELIITLGHPMINKPPAKNRKSTEEIVSFNSYPQ